MEILKILSPTKHKNVYSLVLFVGTTIILTCLSFLSLLDFLSFKFWQTAFPLDIFGFCPVVFWCPKGSNYISWLNIALDLIFWYLVACFVIWYKVKDEK